MAKKKSRYNVKNGNAYDQLLFETIMSQIIDAPIKSLERSTAYKVNDICSEATLPKGGFLICSTTGTTTNTVPTAFGTATEGATITDGTAKFTVRFLDQLVSSVNNNKPDSKGNISLPNFIGSSSNKNGSAGLVPAPKMGEENKVLCADGSWQAAVKTVNGNAPDSAGNIDVKEYTHPDSGVTAGTYRQVTVDKQGHVTKGENPTLAISAGGTGATTAVDAVKALLGSAAVGSAQTPIYYSNGKLVAGNYTFRLNHNTSDTRIPVFSSGAIDYILKSEIATAWTGGGIVAANLNTNGYVKFANNLILQWGTSSSTNRDTTVWYPIAFSTLYTVIGVPKSASNLSGSNSNFGIKNQNTQTFIANMYDNGNGYNGFNWIAMGK